jgi:hypothetical protein
MKTIVNTSLWYLCLSLFFVVNINGQPTANSFSRTVLATLQPGESILSAESCFFLSMNNNQLYLVTRQNNQFFIYENGQRKGPFGTLQGSMLKPCESGRNGDEKCAVYKPVENTGEPEGLSMNESGQYLIKYKDKTFGPYPFVKNYAIWPDKSGFVAIVMDSQMKSTFVTSDGQPIPLKGDVDAIHISPVGKKYVFAVKEREEINLDLMNEVSKMTQEQLLKFAREQEAKQKSAGPPKAYVYASGGAKYGPFEQGAFYTNNPAFTKTGGDNWIMILSNVLYINGQKIKEFENIDLNSCNIWLSKDGKRYAITSYDKLIFTDGKSYGYPMETIAFEKDGKVFIKWISLENEKDLVLYSREI